MSKNKDFLNVSHLQEVQCFLGFLVVQVDPEDPEKYFLKRLEKVDLIIYTVI